WVRGGVGDVGATGAAWGRVCGRMGAPVPRPCLRREAAGVPARLALSVRGPSLVGREDARPGLNVSNDPNVPNEPNDPNDFSGEPPLDSPIGNEPDQHDG